MKRPQACWITCPKAVGWYCRRAPAPLPKTTQFRRLLGSDRLEFLLEAHNGISARIGEEAGFRGLWAGGLCMSAQYGVRDSNEASWTQVLDPGWEEVGVDGRGASLLRRPEYGNPTEADHSANALGACLVVHSASVPWAERGIGYSPAQAMAAAWFDNDFARAMRSVESFARWRSVRG